MKKIITPSANQKVQALYQAVIGLIEENADVNTIKVSDITNKAGIGKGTAYEYFESKEEMVARALLDDMQNQLSEIKECTGHGKTMKEQIYGILDWIESKYSKRRSSIQFFKISNHSYEMGESLYQELQKAGHGWEHFHDILNPIIQQGKKEGIIPKMMPSTLIIMVLISNFTGFFLYLLHLNKISDVTVDETKDFIYGIIKKSFSLGRG